MPQVLTPNVCRVELIFAFASQRLEYVWHIETPGVPTLATCQALWDFFKNWYQLKGRAQHGNTSTLVQIDVTSLHEENGPAYQASVIPGILGQSVGNFETTPFLAVCVRHLTGKKGRSYRGRTYWHSYTTIGADGNLISQAVADALVTLFSVLRTDLQAAGYYFVINSMFSGVQIINGRRRAIPRPQGVKTRVISSACERGIDTNRHRKMPFQV